MLSKALYLANNDQLDLLVYKEVIPFLKAKCSYEKLSLSDDYSFEQYEGLADNTKKIFRDLVYEQYNELQCSKEDFLQLYSFLDFVGFNKPIFLPLFRRYIYNNRDDKEFLRKTAFIHRNKDWLKVDWKELYCIILGIDVNTSIQDIKFIDNPDAIHIYAYCLEKDIENARELYFKNWQYEHHSDSMHQYAHCLQKGIGGEKNEVKARELYLLNWEENRDSDSLYQYAYCLEKGIGGEKNEVKARELYLLNWEENGYKYSLIQYIWCLELGIGGKRDNLEVQRLLKILNPL